MAQDIGSCGWPIWHVDDFTLCFQLDYLKILFPTVIIGVSLVHLILQNVLRKIRRKNENKYDPLEQHLDHTEIPPEDEDSIADSDEDLSIAQNGGRLALVKTTTKGSIVQADSPPGQQLLVLVEELAIAGLVVVNIVSLVVRNTGGRGLLAAVVGILTWTYVLILATLRLFLGNTKWRVPHIWDHTAAIYALQWLFTLVPFRSVLVHPTSKLAQILTIVEFALVSLLFGMAMTTRKGNKTVLLEWEGDIEPSREPLASLFSLMTFGWVDNILWKGYKETYEIGMVWNLLPKDKAASVLTEYRHLKKTTNLAWHLGKFFKGPLILQCLWAILAGVLTFAPTLLLKAILEFVEHPTDGPMSVLWLYVILLPVSDIIRSVADNQALWIGRKMCIRMRAIVIGEIYAKALRRKAATGADAVLAKTQQNGTAESKVDKVKRWMSLRKKDAQKAANAISNKADEAAPAKAADEQANLGTIINLMSVDSFKIGEVTSYLHFLAALAPAQLVVAIVLLWQIMGLSAIPGLVVMVILLPVNILLARGFSYTQKKIMAATDKRIATTNEVLQNIRIIKYFAWEYRFSQIVDEKRRAELKALRNRYMVWATAVAIWNTVPVLITFFSFLVYTKIEQKPLYPSVAFTAISLFMLLRVPLDQLGDMIAHVQEAKVSIERVEEFLKEDETDKYKQLGPDNIDDNGNHVIGFRNATFIWGSKDTVADDGSMAFRLMDLDCDFKIGKLNIIAGPTGSGKTSLLMALLGEMTLMKGDVYLPGGRSREDVRVDPETGLAETCAYVAQSAWLVNANIKENILFSAPYDARRYRNVIVACALERDLEILDNGDETLVGEKGITLSGGQKQRISLARAVYSNSRHLLLDDCLSAVDSHTAQWIFENCIQGPLMRDRTCILVTHNVTLCAPSSEYVVVLDNGRVSAQGTSTEVIATGHLGEELQNKSRPGSVIHVSTVPSRVPSSVGEESDETLVDNGGSDTLTGASKDKKEKKKVDAMEETKATGAVKWSVLKLYLNAMGKWWFWVLTIFVFTGQQLSSVASNLWIKEWANQYTTEEQAVSSFQFGTSSITPLSSSFAPKNFASMTSYIKDQRFFSPAEYSAASAPPEVNVNYYLFMLALIGIIGALFALFRDLWLFFGSLTASYKIHNKLMAAVSRAKFKFFDITPLGQLMNRFSKDLEAIDQEVAPVAIGVMSCALAIVVTVVLIGCITPGFLIAALFITVLYIGVAVFYLRASRDLKRLDSVYRSPLFQQFGETLSGVTTIRAYGDERRFIRENLTKINTQARPFIYLWAANRWLAFRTDCLGNMVAFFAGVFVITSIGKLDAGSAGISLSYAISFSDNILWLIRLYAMNEQNMNSVERVKEYLDVEQEAEPINEKNRPPQNWPAQGSVEFVGYTTRYREDLDPVLRDLTFKIQPFEKVGIVGRTGAGKSSLALALFRALEAEKGKILIDDIDVGQLGLKDLREAITIVPQDPTLFTGTIRTNLDPFDLYTDEEIFTALRRVQLIAPDEDPATPVTLTASRRTLPPNSDDEDDRQSDNSTPTATNKNIFLDLSSTVAESGSNLSQGQRQLLCLARAMLKQPKVLIMDEATASIDYSTDSKIQGTIRELKGTTITIAHRLATIVDYDKVLVLDHGSVVEFGHPWELLKKSDGSFRSMCETSGDIESLTKAAKKAYEANRLVDDE
ncbi:ABC transporter type 1, transmembrane domain-containing protein [Pestalotiopsis sp. NC0098]|nr:ABC transporter type 1, transmembrane domain-containing protein [Pestalotiopsis sp. NC0098]